jgi:hypothetical protein
MVVVSYTSPGRKTVDGNWGWLGESGKCWVIEHRHDAPLVDDVALVAQVRDVA